MERSPSPLDQQTYNADARTLVKKTSWAELQDKAPKNHLTQMQTIGSTAIDKRSGSVRPTDSSAQNYFGMTTTPEARKSDNE